MTLRVETADSVIVVDLDRVASALQHARHVPYAPPHVFPMSAPQFEKRPEASRPVPANRRMGVYIHIPYCRYVCNFCFYVKHVSSDRGAMQRYTKVLIDELNWLPRDTEITQLFVGGGTPTALPADLLDEILAAALGRVSRGSEGIHTVECSPETLTPQHLDVLSKHGIGRISMGVQSLVDDVLHTVERNHTADQAIEACRQLVASGKLVNVDLIYGLPGQTYEMFRSDFATVAGTGVHGINAYNLRINERTTVRELLRPEERLELANLIRWRACVERTALESGYRQTHWQRFLRPDRQFELDLTSDNLFGAGVSARSFLNGTVYRNHAGISTYLDRIASGRSPVEEVFALRDVHHKTYFVTRSLGCGKPLLCDAYEQSFGCSFDDDYGPLCRRLLDADLITRHDNQVGLTPLGRLLYDLVTLAFYPESLQCWLQQRHEAAVAGRD